MTMEDENKKNIQKMLDKLISDEWFAGNVYKQFVLLIDPQQATTIEELMLETAQDEIDDHLANLANFAARNGYSIPATYGEMKKFADKEDVKLFEKCAKGKDALFYIEEALKSEQRAIEVYDKYVDEDQLNAVPELQMIIKNNFYDEIDHFKNFKFAKESIEAMKQYKEAL